MNQMRFGNSCPNVTVYPDFSSCRIKQENYRRDSPLRKDLLSPGYKNNSTYWKCQNSGQESGVREILKFF